MIELNESLKIEVMKQDPSLFIGGYNILEQPLWDYINIIGWILFIGFMFLFYRIIRNWKYGK